MRSTALILGFLCSCWASAQWTVVNLHPPGATAGSIALSVRDGKQVGIVDGRAGVWSGTAASWQSLHPTGDLSSAEGIYGNQQAGTVFLISGGHPRASLWEGTPQSWVNLNPDHAGAAYSFCYDTSGDQQVGSANITGVSQASLWTGSAASWVSLHPAGYAHSEVAAVDASVQVGKAGSFGAYHAGMWTGTAGSWIDLNPAGIGESFCTGVGDGQQVGSALVGGASHASLWTGTATSWIDLHPAGAISSDAAGADGGLQVGNARVGIFRACVWYGTAGSWVDLGSFLLQPLGSTAHDIWQDGPLTYIVGEWRGSGMNHDEAVMWVSRAVSPASYSMVR